jgi:hypothetical protein
MKSGGGADPISPSSDSVPSKCANNRSGNAYPADAVVDSVTPITIYDIEQTVWVPRCACWPSKLRRNAGAVRKAGNTAAS